MGNIELVATSTFGLEAIVAQEVRNLGFDDVKVENGRVTFIAKVEDCLLYTSRCV